VERVVGMDRQRHVLIDRSPLKWKVQYIYESISF